MEFKVLKGGESANDTQGIEAYKYETRFTAINIPTDNKDSVFGMILRGKVLGFVGKKINEVNENEYFAGSFDSFIVTPGTCVCLIRKPNFGTPVQIGEVPATGRLKYIDGAFNNLLMSPPKKGDPCLNALYMAREIDQTPHTHPSTRIGMILRGQVTVKIWDSEGYNAQVINELLLKSGDVWFMGKDTVHSFHTQEADDMSLFAFHPDSDYGPTDEEAPMINRTLIEGVSSKGNNEPKKTKLGLLD